MPRWNTVAIIGVGLIGGSIGLALRKRGLASDVIGIGRQRPGSALEVAKQLGAITSSTVDIQRGVTQTDLVIVCTPVKDIAQHLLQAAQFAPDNALLTDAGSTKAAIVQTVEASLPLEKHFVGSHPLAGSEKKGVQHARADLFENRTVVITPTRQTKADDLQSITEFWTALGTKY